METDDILSPLPVDANQYFAGRSAGTKISPKFKFPMSAPAVEQSRLNKLRFNFDFDCSHTVADKKDEIEEVSISRHSFHCQCVCKMSSFRPISRRRTLLKTPSLRKNLSFPLSRFSATNVTHFCIYTKHSGKTADHDDMTHLYRINKILSQHYYDSSIRVIYLFLFFLDYFV